MDPINKKNLFVSIFLPAPWIRGGEWDRGTSPSTAERRRSWTRDRSTARAKRRSRAAKGACRAEALGRGQKGLWQGGSGWHGTAIWRFPKIGVPRVPLNHPA